MLEVYRVILLIVHFPPHDLFELLDYLSCDLSLDLFLLKRVLNHSFDILVFQGHFIVTTVVNKEIFRDRSLVI